MGRIGRQTPTFTNCGKIRKSLGDEAVELYKKSGQKLMDWQSQQVSMIMDTDNSGDWRYVKYGLQVSRRNGKGEILAARELWALEHAEKVCHSAHRATTSHEAYERLYRLLRKLGYQEAQKNKRELEPGMFFSSKKSGQERLELYGGGTVDFRTRTNAGGLGEGFDLLIIDEAQEYTSKQESTLTYTVSASANPQTILTGTPPTAVSAGDVFQRLHDNVLKGSVEDTGWSEWSIDEQTSDISNTALWYEYNPSLGIRLKERTIRAEMDVGEVDFNIQRLGLWLKYSQKSEISAAEWDMLKADAMPELTPRYFLGVKFGRNGANIALSIAAKTADGSRVFVETIACRPMRGGHSWILDYCHNPKFEGIAIDGANGQALLAEAVRQSGFAEPVLPRVQDIVAANALFEQAITAQGIVHMGQAGLRGSVTNCEHRAIGSNGGFGYRSISDLHDITVMESAVLAHWLAATAGEPQEPQTIDY